MAVIAIAAATTVGAGTRPGMAAGTDQAGSDPAGISIELEPVVGGLERAVAVTSAGDGSGRLFVIEKAGRIRIIRDGELLPEPFLDITDRVESRANERGLLGIAFHPRYAENGTFYVNYTTSRPTGNQSTGDSVNARFQVTSDPDRADPSSELTILTYAQPYANHNGGDLRFGPDGYLYIGTGDGGNAGDPQNRAQNGQSLLGKMLRIDVDGGTPYAIPADNPFVADDDVRDEIWALGLRNPWRYSFDPATGDLYIGDVGQNQWEEIDFQPADSVGGENYGWRVMEGTHCYSPPRDCDQTGLVPPIAEYGRGDGQSVTGGEVYRGRRFPDLNGAYFYADYASETMWALSRGPDGSWRNAEVGQAGFRVAAFGLGEDGEIYLTSDAGANSGVYHLIDAGAPPVTATSEATPTTGPTHAATAAPTETGTAEPLPTSTLTPESPEYDVWLPWAGSGG